MRELEQHLAATAPRASRRASLNNIPGLSSARSLPPRLQAGRRSSLGFNNTLLPSAPPTSPKKATRRASLGQMLGSAQKFFTKDDAATVESCSNSSCNMSLGGSEDETKALLKEVKQLIAHHAARKLEMERIMESDLELAKARLSSGNQLGAILSMRRVHKNTTMLAYAAGARYQLAQLRDSLENNIACNVAQHRRAMRDITAKLLHADAPTPSDAFLLNQLESQMDEVGI